MRIYNNLTALKSSNNLNKVNKVKSGNLEKLSSGLRINKASDDAAGLAISEKMRGQIRGLKVAARNSSDGQALIQTAEGAMNEINSILQRQRELCVQASNDTYSADERNHILTELTELTAQVKTIVDNTKFNGITMLDGTYDTGNPLNLQIGANKDDTLEIAFVDADAIHTALGRLDVDDSDKAQDSIALLDAQLDAVSTSRAQLGAQVNRLDFTINNINSTLENLTDAESRIRDLDMASEMVEFTRNNILSQTGIAMLSSANSMTQGVLQLLG